MLVAPRLAGMNDEPGDSAAEELVTTQVGQAAFHDVVEDQEFEIERPAGATALYRWVIEEKFRRSIAGLEQVLRDATALTVCGGSGMDAELLARSGAQVISSDISLGASKRAAERGRRHGLSLGVIVADIENLPFADRSIDLVYVHDGLHHLENPDLGLSEMLRVSKKAVSVTEPADASATGLALALGIAKHIEPAGNVVHRFRLQDLQRRFAACGFRTLVGGRYFLYYGHKPGWASRVLSSTPLLWAARTFWRALNTAVGSLGNKLGVVAQR